MVEMKYSEHVFDSASFLRFFPAAVTTSSSRPAQQAPRVTLGIIKLLTVVSIQKCVSSLISCAVIDFE